MCVCLLLLAKYLQKSAKGNKTVGIEQQSKQESKEVSDNSTTYVAG